MAVGDEEKKEETAVKEGRRRVVISSPSISKGLRAIAPATEQRGSAPPAPPAPAKRGEVSEFFNKQLNVEDASPGIIQTRTRPTLVLQRMPFSVLLVQLSDLSLLPGFRGFLEERLDELQGSADAGEEGRKDEENMLSQALQWLSIGKDGAEVPNMSTPSHYTPEIFRAVYELGRLYFEMGYYGAAERIFSGLSAADPGSTPAAVGLGLVRLERGSFEEAAGYFRAALDGPFKVQARIGLTAAFLGGGDIGRAKSVLQQLAKDIDLAHESAEIRTLYDALMLRCSE